MKTIQIYDPPMCCSSGVCGNDVDPALIRLASWLAALGRRGVSVERFNLAQQPMAFVQNPEVKALLDSDGMSVLPLTFIEGKVFLRGRYPTDGEQKALSSEAASRDLKTIS